MAETTLDEVKAVAMRYFDELTNKQDVGYVDQLFTDDIAFYDPAIVPDGEAHGHEEVKQFFTVFFKVFPDVHFAIDDFFAEGDKAAIRFTWTGTHKTEFLGIELKERHVAVPGIDIFHVARRKDRRGAGGLRPGSSAPAARRHPPPVLSSGAGSPDGAPGGASPSPAASSPDAARRARARAGRDGAGPGGQRGAPVRGTAAHPLRPRGDPACRCRRQRRADPADDARLRRPGRRPPARPRRGRRRRDRPAVRRPAPTTRWRPTTPSRLAYLRSHLQDSQVFYAHAVGRTLDQVRDEARLRVAVEDFLDRRVDFLHELSPHQVRAQIREFVVRRPDPVLGPGAREGSRR